MVVSLTLGFCMVPTPQLREHCRMDHALGRLVAQHVDIWEAAVYSQVHHTVCRHHI